MGRENHYYLRYPRVAWPSGSFDEGGDYATGWVKPRAAAATASAPR